MPFSSKILLAKIQFISIILCITVFLFACTQEPTENKYAQLGGDFSLETTSGTQKLSDYTGKTALLFFGFSSCPDFCPTTLVEVSQALALLDDDERAKIQPLMIGVDPSRDTPAKLQEYVDFFIKDTPKMLAMTGDISTLETIARQYGAYFKATPLAESALGYTIEHTVRLYIIDANGILVDTVEYGNSPQTIANSLRKYL